MPSRHILFSCILLVAYLEVSQCSTVVDYRDNKKALYVSDYCPKMEFCPEGAHVMCMYYNPKSVMGPRCSQPRNVSITRDIANKLLEVSNAVRSKLALGKEKGKGGVTLPRAYGMMRLRWDKELATFAQVLANQCVLRHDLCHATKRFPDPGQTAGLVRFSYPDWHPISKSAHFEKTGLTLSKLNYATTQSLKSWYSHKDHVSPDMIHEYPDWTKHPDKLSGRLYFEMIAGSSTHMGCGISAYTEYGYNNNKADLNYNSVQIICNYSSRSKTGKPVYSTTPPSQVGRTTRCGCPDGYDEDDDCLCSPSLKATVAPPSKPSVVLLPIFTVEDAPSKPVSRMGPEVNSPSEDIEFNIINNTVPHDDPDDIFKNRDDKGDLIKKHDDISDIFKKHEDKGDVLKKHDDISDMFKKYEETDVAGDMFQNHDIVSDNYSDNYKRKNEISDDDVEIPEMVVLPKLPPVQQPPPPPPPPRPPPRPRPPPPPPPPPPLQYQSSVNNVYYQARPRQPSRAIMQNRVEDRRVVVPHVRPKYYWEQPQNQYAKQIQRSQYQPPKKIYKPSYRIQADGHVIPNKKYTAPKKSIFSRVHSFALPRKTLFGKTKLRTDNIQKDVPPRHDFAKSRKILTEYLNTKSQILRTNSDSETEHKDYVNDIGKPGVRTANHLESDLEHQAYLRNFAKAEAVRTTNLNRYLKNKFHYQGLNVTNEHPNRYDIKSVNDETDDKKLMILLDSLEKEVKNIDLDKDEKEIFDAKIRKIYGAVVGKDGLRDTKFPLPLIQPSPGGGTDPPPPEKEKPNFKYDPVSEGFWLDNDDKKLYDDKKLLDRRIFETEDKVKAAHPQLYDHYSDDENTATSVLPRRMNSIYDDEKDEPNCSKKKRNFRHSFNNADLKHRPSYEPDDKYYKPFNQYSRRSNRQNVDRDSYEPLDLPSRNGYRRYEDKADRHFEDKTDRHFEDKTDRHFEDKTDRHFEDKTDRHFEDKTDRHFEDRPDKDYKNVENRINRRRRPVDDEYDVISPRAYRDYDRDDRFNVNEEKEAIREKDNIIFDPLSTKRRKLYRELPENMERKNHDTRAGRRKAELEHEMGPSPGPGMSRAMRPTHERGPPIHERGPTHERVRAHPKQSNADSFYIPDRARFLHGF